ncbi:hypothetical protein SAMD00019534_004480, partial [Acytostelium subglobosum LB1]|uniref:hypothetical protein n=1 Tax=Acytostelium subglobosum LB1 TaxID=1410327 RepID=UPI000644F4EE
MYKKMDEKQEDDGASLIPKTPSPTSAKAKPNNDSTTAAGGGGTGYRKTSDNLSKNSNSFFSDLRSTVQISDAPAQQQTGPDGQIIPATAAAPANEPAKPKTFIDGTLRGLASIGTGIVSGVAGIVQQPYKGAKKDGVAGFAKGVVKGVGGVVLLPVVGVMEFVSLTSQGIMNTPLTVIDAMKNAPKDDTLQQVTAIEDPLFFGINITESIERAQDKGVPHLIRIGLDFLTPRVNHEGLFRLSGSKLEIDKMQVSFDKGEITGVDKIDKFKVNEMAGVFKAYFRFMPDSIFPAECISKLVEIQQRSMDPLEKVLAIKTVIIQMDDPHYSVIYLCVELLTKICQNSKESLMTPSNLSIIFGPAWFRPSQDFQEVANCNTIVFNLISFFPQIFTRAPSTVL